MDKKNTFLQRVAELQNKLKAPKNQVNNFGNFKYRNCEDILEAVKPLLVEYKLTLNIEDHIELLGDRYYIKATALLIDQESTGSLKSQAYARETADKKGMDQAQVTGATSSYARKYALNGLLLIDDSKEMDSMNNKVETKPDKYALLKSALNKLQDEASAMMNDELSERLDKALEKVKDFPDLVNQVNEIRKSHE